MRYALLASTRTVAALLPDGPLLDLAAALESPPETTLSAALDPSLPARIAALSAGAVASARRPADTPLLAPLPRPNRILAIGRNYAEHARELGNAVPDEPVVFLKPSTAVIGPGAAIRIPEWVGRVDYEGELLVVLGRGGKEIAESDALACIAGYTGFNDVTAREKSKALQGKGHPWFLAKGRDTFAPMGPCLVTADEIGDPGDLRVTLSVNGVLRQDGRTSQMLHSIPKLIAFLSRWVALEPGDTIATGTPPGVGPLAPGDTVTVEIEKIGALTNPVLAE